MNINNNHIVKGKHMKTSQKQNVRQEMGIFGEYLTLWVALCIVAGVSLGHFAPQIPNFLAQFEYANVSIPVAILIWLMIFPMMLKVDFESIKRVGQNPKGLILTCTMNWLVKPFTMFAIASFFIGFLFKGLIPAELGRSYIAGAVLLGAAPCTAMVFVWSHLTKGNPAYTVVQVAVNDLILLVLFAPIVAFLLGVSDVKVPMDTLFLSVVLFVVIPLVAGFLVRKLVIDRKGLDYFEGQFLKKFDKTTIIGLLVTLIIIFAFQGNTILEKPQDILLIAIPLIIQTFLIFGLTYFAAYKMKLAHEIAAPSAMIGASNFFELAVAVAIAIFGLESGATLATVVGVLVEVPVMLALVNIANKTKDHFN